MLSNTPIIIPTYKRIFKQDTWATIHSELRKFIIFVVRPEEADEMRVRYAPSQVDVLPASVKDIMATRQYIWDKYSKLYDAFFQMDDDISGFSFCDVTYQEDGKPKFKYTPCAASIKKADRVELSVELQLNMFKRCLDELSSSKYPNGVGMTSPRPNWMFPSAGKDYPTNPNKLVTGFYCYNAKLLRDKIIRFNDWASCGDTNACMDVLSYGIQTTYCTDYMYVIAPLVGTSMLRARVVKDHEEMAVRWAGFMNPRESKKDGELGALSSYTYLRKKLFEAAPMKGTK